MSRTIVECVPNFSEGRRLDVVDAIVAAIASVPEVHVLHRTSDPDHNRSVVTFAGSPQGVVKAAFRGIKTASELIDMDDHRGVHPRIGATDVVPFIPLEGVTMQDCVALSRQLGQRVAEELDIPVYLYEYSATRPERRNLANLRRGQYEGLKEAIQQPERHPDFGLPYLGKAGATVIGARKLLIAYNVFLDTTDENIAKAIAKELRESSGGLARVKALGFFVRNHAQVSINITDYHITPLHVLMGRLRELAAARGVKIIESELIGLIPSDALYGAAAAFLQLYDFSAQRVLDEMLKSDKK